MRLAALLVLPLLSGCLGEEPPPPRAPMPTVHLPWVTKRFGGTMKHPPPSPSASASPSTSVSTPPASTSASTPPASEAMWMLPKGPRSGPLRAKGWHNPMPGGVVAGYVGDTGLDIAGSPRTVYAIAAAKVDYAEAGHTRWTGPKDSPYCIRLALDVPVAWKNHKITHVYYAHLSSLELTQKEGEKPARHVEAGEPLGTSGVARGVPHLHLGLLLDDQVEQDDWTFILREGEVRVALGGYKNGEVLPKEPL